MGGMRRMILVAAVNLLVVAGLASIPAGAASESTATAAGPPLVCEGGIQGPHGQQQCTKTVPAGGGSSGSSVSPEALWNRYCFGPFLPGFMIPYAPGASVSLSIQGKLPLEEYDVVRWTELSQPIYPRTPWLDPAKSYDIVRITCVGTNATTGYVTVFETGTIVVVDIFALRAEALAGISVPKPAPGSNPPFGQPGTFGIVRIPTWFWVDPATWVPLSSSASAAGFVVTVTATPVRAEWDPGDGTAPLICAGPGVAWAPGMAESATDCAHSYTSSSADQPGADYPVQVTTTWEFTWTLNGADQGAFGTTTAATAFNFQVGEIQAIESA
jgi:hypothetical protein